MPPRFRFFRRRGKPLLKMTVEKKEPKVWKFLTNLAKVSFATKFVLDVFKTIKKAILPEVNETEEKITKSIAEIPERELPIRDIERLDILDSITTVETRRGFAIGVPEGVVGSRSGEEVSRLMEELESLGKVKEITERSRPHFIKRGFLIPEGAKYLVIPPKATFGPAFDELRKNVTQRAASVGLQVVIDRNVR